MTTPTIEDLSEEINSRYEQSFPSQQENRTNPNTEIYSSVQRKFHGKLTENPNFGISYSSPKESFKTERRVAVLIGDNHMNKDLAVDQYQLLKGLYTDEDLFLSSSFNEGKTSAESAYPTIPEGLSEAQIINDIRTERMAQETAVLYTLRSKVESASIPYLAYNPESLSQAEDLDIMLGKLISISTGIAATVPDAEHKVFKGLSFEVHKLNLMKLAYEHGSLEHEFYALLGSRIKDMTSKLGYDEALQRRIAEATIETVETFSDANRDQDPTSWQNKYHQAPRMLDNAQTEKLYEQIFNNTQELTLKTRNQRMADMFAQTEPGTRTMIVGANHYSKKVDGKSLIDRLEEKGIPVIVIEGTKL